ncbi:di-heme-cytochrome C peroxidase [Endothiovibrio diazotrophicus]
MKRRTLTAGIVAALLATAANGTEMGGSSGGAPATHGIYGVAVSPLVSLEGLKAGIGDAEQDIDRFARIEAATATTAAVDWTKIIKIVKELAGAYQTFKTAATEPLPPMKPVAQWEYLQNFTPEQQEWYRRTPQGTYFMPYDWFLALEVPAPWQAPSVLSEADVALKQLLSARRTAAKATAPGERFASPEYLARFGMLTLPKSKYNPDGLPAGLTRQTGYIDPNHPNAAPQTVLGMGCALCHAGKLEAGGKTVYMDGAPSQVSLDLFGAKFVVALAQTLLPDRSWNFDRFNRFATAVYGHKPSDREWFKLYVELAGYAVSNAMSASGEPSTPAGFSRLDALDNIGNQVFGVDIGPKSNMYQTTAPVSYPMVWTVPWLAWAEYPGVVRSPMIRNVGEALGVKAAVNLTTADPALLYQSTALVDELYRFETLLMEGEIPWDITKEPTSDPWQYVKENKALPGLQPPSWEEGVAKGLLPSIDRTKAAAGKQLYQSLCQGCHLPPLDDPAIGEVDGHGNLNPAYWEPASADEGVAPEFQRQFLRVKKLNIQEIGTDPQEVLNFALRYPNFDNMTWAPDSGIPRGIPTTDANGTPKVGETISMADGLKYTTEVTANRWYRDNGITDPATIARLDGYRPNVVLLEPTYRARPLDGVWATGPYLHNGSVANLYEMLLPADRRATRFITGMTEFDPVKVGYKSYENDPAGQAAMQKEGYSLFTVNDTDGKPMLGNSNAGHEFKGDGKAPLGNGIIGRSLSDEERYQLIEYLKTL